MKNTLLLLWILLIVCTCLAQMDLPPEQNDYYIYWGDAKVGYFTYKLQPLPGGWKMDSETFMSVAANGKPGKIRFVSEWNLDQNMMPVSYRSDIFSGDELKQSTIVSVSGDTTRIIIGESMRTISSKEPFYILDTSTPDGWILVMKNIEMDRDSTIHWRALLPQIGRLFPLEIQPGHIEEDGAGQMRKYFLKFGEFNIEVYAKTRSKRLVYWNFTTQEIVAKWTSELNKDEFLTSEPNVDVTEAHGTSKRIWADTDIEYPTEINKLEIEIDIEYPVSIEPFYESRTQSFDGKLTDRKLNGRVIIRAVENDGKKALMTFPAGPIEEPAAGTLRPSEGIQSDNPKIIEKATSLSANAANFWEVASSINRFVTDSIEAGTSTFSAKSVLESRAGDAISQSRLCCAILRAAGIPSRIVGGYYLENGFWIEHHWVEAWMGRKSGWVQIDPTTGEDSIFTAAHLLLWIGEGRLDYPNQNSISIVSWK